MLWHFNRNNRGVLLSLFWFSFLYIEDNVYVKCGWGGENWDYICWLWLTCDWNDLDLLWKYFLCFELFKIGFVGREFRPFIRENSAKFFFSKSCPTLQNCPKKFRIFQFYPRVTSSTPLVTQISSIFEINICDLENFFSHLIWKWLLCDYNYIYRKVYLIKWRKLYLQFICLMKFLLFTWFYIVKWLIWSISITLFSWLFFSRNVIIFALKKKKKKRKKRKKKWIRVILLQWFLYLITGSLHIQMSTFAWIKSLQSNLSIWCVE